MSSSVAGRLLVLSFCCVLAFLQTSGWGQVTIASDSDSILIGTGVTVNGDGTITISQDPPASGASVASGSWTVNNPATTTVNADSSVTGGTASLSVGRISLGGNALTISVANADAAVQVVVGGSVSGSGSLTKSGDGALLLNAASTHSGGTTLEAGLLKTGANNALGSGTITINGGTLNVQGFNHSVAGVSLTGGSVVGSGTITSLSSIDARNGTAGAVLAGTVALVKTTGDTVVLAGANRYTGGTRVTEGVLQAGATNALGTGTLAVSGNATADLQSFNQSVGGVVLEDGAITGSGSLVSGTAIDARKGTIAAVVGGTAGLSKTTADTVVLGATNSFSGGVSVSDGVLQAGTANAFGTGTLTVSSSGIADLNGNNQEVGGVVLNGGAIADSGSSGTLTSRTAVDARSGTVDAILGGTAGLVKSTTGTVQLNKTNTYSGGTTVGAGTLLAGASGALGTGTLTVNTSGTVDLSGNAQSVAGIVLAGGSITGDGGISSSGSIDARAGVVNSAISGNGALNKSTSGTVVLGAANNYTGGTNVSAGTLQAGTDGALGAGSLTVSGGRVTIGSSNQSVAGLVITGGSIVGSGLVTTASDIDARAGVLNASLGGAVALVKSGSGTVVLGAANQYSAGTTVNDGLLQAGASSAIGGGSLRMNGGTLDVGSTQQTIDGLILSGGSIVGTGTVTSGTNIDARNGVVNAVLDGSSALNKSTAGTVVLGAANSYGGGTNVSAGTLRTSVNNALGSGSLTVSGGNVDVAATSQAVAGVVLSGGSILGTGSVNSGTDIDARSGTVNAALTGSQGLNKTTAGTVVLGRTNTYSGGTTVGEGTLRVAANNALGSGSLALNGGVLDVGATLQSVSALTLAGGSVVGTGSVASGSAIDAQSGLANVVLAGAVALNKTTAGTVVLSRTNTYSGGTNVSGGTLQAGAQTVLGTGTLSISDNGTLDLNGFNQNVSGLVLSGGRITGGGTLTSATLMDLRGGTVGSVLGGSAGLSKTTADTVILAAANSFSGGASVSGGTLRAGVTNALGSGTVTVSSSGVLDVDGFNQSAGGLVLDGGQVVGSGSFYSGSAINARSGEVSARLAGAVALNKTTVGTVVLSGSNSYSGGTNIADGVLRAGTQNVLGSGSLTVGGVGTLDLNGNDQTVSGLVLSGGTVSGAGVLRSNSAIDARSGEVSSILGGTAALNKTTGGTVALSGANTYSGGTNISEGVLRAGAQNVLGAGTVTVGSGGALDLSTFNQSVAGVVLSGGSILGDGVLTSGSTIDARSGSVAVVLSGTMALSKTTGGTVVLGAANTYTGGTRVNGGILRAGVDDAVSGALSVGAGGTLDVVATAQNVSALILTGGSITGTGNGSVSLSAGSFDVQSGTVSAILGGGAAVQKTTAGLLVLSGSNTYSGGTHLEGGTVRVGADAALGSGNVTLVGASGATVTLTALGAGERSFSNNVTVGSSVVFGDALNAGSLNFNGSVTLGESANAVSVAGATTVVLAGALGETQANSSLTKAGAGTMILRGTGASYTGSTTVNAGTVRIAGASSIGSGSLHLNQGAALTVDGGGAVDLSNFVTIGGSVSFGDATNAGSITLSGSVALNAANGNAQITVQPAAMNVIVSGVISDGGTLAQKLTKAGAGILELQQANHYTGGTSIRGGTLRILDEAALGTGALEILGGVLDSTQLSSFTLTQSLALTDSLFSGGGTLSAVSVTGSNTITDSTTFAGAVTGTGGIVVNNPAAVVTLSSTNTYSGGTNLSAGTIVSGANNALGSGSLAIGAANLDLGGFSQSSSSLALNGGSIQGTGSTLLVSDTITATSGTVAVVLGGSAGLSKTGSGELILSGTNTFTGATVIGAGTINLGSTGKLASSVINVGTSAGSGAKLIATAPIDLSGNQTIKGSGVVQGTLNFAPGSVIAPGNSPGTLTVSAITGAPLYQWERSANSYDSIALAGAGSDLGNVTILPYSSGAALPVASLTGDSLARDQVRWSSGVGLPAGVTVTGGTLTYSGIITGTFTGTPSLSSSVTPTAVVTVTLANSTASSINLTVNRVTYASLGLTPPAKKMGAKYDQLLNLANYDSAGVGQILRQLDSLTTAAAVSQRLASLDNSSSFAQTYAAGVSCAQAMAVSIDEHLDSIGAPSGGTPLSLGVKMLKPARSADAEGDSAYLLESDPEPSPAVAEAARWTAWTSGYGTWSSLDATEGFSKTTSQDAGSTLGLERRIGNIRVGLLTVVGQGTTTMESSSTKITADHWHVGAYTAVPIGTVTVDASVLWGNSDQDSRQTQTGAADTTARFSSRDLQLGVGIAANLAPATSAWSITPIARLKFLNFTQESFTDSDGSHVGRMDVSTVYSKLGLRVAHVRLVRKGLQLGFDASSYWMHNFDPNGRSVEVSAGGLSYTAVGRRGQADAVQLGVGMQAVFSERVVLRLSGVYEVNAERSQTSGVFSVAVPF